MHSDNRRFLRVPVCGNSRTVVVRLDGKRSLTCELLNTSSGGYGVAVAAQHSGDFPPGRILVLEVDDVVIQVKVAHVAWDEQWFQVGFERIAELEDKAAGKGQQASWFSTLAAPAAESGPYQSTLVRDLVIAAVLVCSCLAFFFLPPVLEKLQSKKKPRALSVPALITPSAANPAKSATTVQPPPKSPANAVDVDGRLGVLPRN